MTSKIAFWQFWKLSPLNFVNFLGLTFSNLAVFEALSILSLISRKIWIVTFSNFHNTVCWQKSRESNILLKRSLKSWFQLIWRNISPVRVSFSFYPTLHNLILQYTLDSCKLSPPLSSHFLKATFLALFTK